MSGNTRKRIFSVTGAVVLGVLGFFIWQRMRIESTSPSHDQAPRPEASSQLARKPEGPLPRMELIGERILSHYADPARRPEEDLTDIAHALGNFALLVKGDNPLPLGANEEIASALRGKNRAQLRFLPETHRVFNAQGQIVDRWGTPLFFHAASSDRLEVRSAGPDRIMWTADDLHRAHDGRFLKRDDLLPPSLFDPARKTGAHTR